MNEVAHPRPRRLLRRILLGQLIVIAAGGTTLGAVAYLIAPPIFRDHVRRAVGPVSDIISHHLDEALSETLAIALTVGVTAATIVAVTVAWLLTSRLARPIESLSNTARRLSDGDLQARADVIDGDDELAELTTAFNAMADSLEDSERTRRQLLSDLAHELRTPLATLEAYHEGMRDSIVEADDATMTVLDDATGRLARLIDDLALVSEAEEGRLDLRLDRLDIGRLAAATVEAARPVATGAGVELACTAPSRPAIVEGDSVRLGQALANVLSNAIRHTPSGGRVLVRCVAQPDHVMIMVTDTGSGIASEHLPYIFQRFYRADPSRQRSAGSGIGLTISRAILRQHRGSLTAHSAGHGHGATFTLTLPTQKELQVT